MEENEEKETEKDKDKEKKEKKTKKKDKAKESEEKTNKTPNKTNKKSTDRDAQFLLHDIKCTVFKWSFNTVQLLVKVRTVTRLLQRSPHQRVRPLR